MFLNPQTTFYILHGWAPRHSGVTWSHMKSHDFNAASVPLRGLITSDLQASIVNCAYYIYIYMNLVSLYWKKVLHINTKQWMNPVMRWPPLIDSQRTAHYFVLSTKDSCVIWYMLDYEVTHLLCLFIKVYKKKFNAIKIKYLITRYKPHVTLTQQHSTYMFQSVIY